ncbi:MAG: hypothetical protein ACRDVW_04305 [Acidimicrobiales bacterium]
MSGSQGFEDGGPRRSLLYRLLHGPNDLSVSERFQTAVLKPADPNAKPAPEPRIQSIDELREAERYADDRERFLGLVAAPLAAAIGFLIANYLIEHDPAAHLKNGLANPAHGNVTTYHSLEFVLLGLAIAMLASAWYRKRLFLGMTMTLYGLGVFNLHYWGFGVPFLLGGAWILVHAYRAHQAVREASGEGRFRGGAASRYSRPKANKRYTPPV